MELMSRPPSAEAVPSSFQLDTVVRRSGPEGVAELSGLVSDLLSWPLPSVSRILQEPLPSRKPRVYRLRLVPDSRSVSLVAKRLDPHIARRDQFVVKRWLPAIGLSGGGPPLLGIAVDRGGRCVWHVYEDLGDGSLLAADSVWRRVETAVRYIARVHGLGARHPLLAECRNRGADYGPHFFTSTVRDALRALGVVSGTATDPSGARRGLRERLQARLERLLEEAPGRAQLLCSMGDPETCVHGDLRPGNIFVFEEGREGGRVRLVDWDHLGVGSFSYDLSTFLSCLPPTRRAHALAVYRAAMTSYGWNLPPDGALNLLFDTAELARIANRVIWPAIALAHDGADWAYDELAEIEGWFERWRPLIDPVAVPPEA